jgi:hypothetical protein
LGVCIALVEVLEHSAVMQVGAVDRVPGTAQLVRKGDNPGVWP